MQPDLLLMDEPFSSLDTATRQGLQNLTLELWNEHRLTLVIVTHSIEEAVFLGRKILVLPGQPNRDAAILDNPQTPTPALRDTESYQTLCKEVQLRLQGS
jgi:NitT/TauT family transport system ATP-binding protein